MTFALPPSPVDGTQPTGESDAPAHDDVHTAEQALWFSGNGEWELGLLGRLVEEGFAAARDVAYPDNYGRPSSRLRFRVTGVDGDALSINATGTTTITSGVDGEIFIDVDSGTSGPAGFAIGAHQFDAVEVLTDNGSWGPAASEPGSWDTPPHLLRNPVHEWPMTHADDVWSVPVELLGRVVIRTVDPDCRPVIWAGESRREATERAHLEQFVDVRRRSDGSWESVHELGLRYLVVDDSKVESVHIEAVAPAERSDGLFACSDDRLNQIWNAAAHTLLICSQGLIVDGVKRDRMPWMGDLSLGALANAYVTGDAEIVRKGLIALSRHSHGYINGIVDYTLWWLICLDQADNLYPLDGLRRSEADRVDDILRRLEAEVGSDGVLRPRPAEDSFDKPIFIDWGVDIRPNADSTALQLLWWWALGSAVRLLTDAEHPAWEHWAQVRDRLAQALRSTAWVDSDGAWREYLGGEKDPLAYSDAFAVLSGWFGGAPPERLSERLRSAPATRTPFVTSYVLQAVADSGDRELAVARIRELWGAMLEHGATTFWEEFPIPGLDPLEMYGRPYGKSLCHAWAAGPAYLLPQVVLGLRPTGRDWTSFAVDPQLGDLEWARAVVPTSRGKIEVHSSAEGTTVMIPDGCTLEHRGSDYPGPGRVRLR